MRLRLLAHIILAVTALNVGSLQAQDGIALPDAPSNLTALLRLPASIELRWADNSTDEINFKISRYKGNVQLAEKTFTAYANQTSYNDSVDLVSGQEYCYEIRSLGIFGVSQPTNRACVTAIVIEPTEPPSDLVAEADPPDGIQVTWKDNATNDLRVILQRSGDQGVSWQDILLDRNAEAYTDLDIDDGTTYCYRAKSQNEYFTSDYSAISCATAEIVTPPAAASGFLVRANPPESIELSWSDLANNETAWIVEKSADAGTSWEAIQLSFDSAKYSDRDVVDGGEYCYRVYAENAYHESARSDNLCAVAVIVTPPASPGGFSAVSNPPNTIELSWIDNADNDRVIVVRRSEAGSNWTEIILPADAQSYSDSDITDGVNYCYEVFSRNDYFSSDATDISCVDARVVTPPDTPSNLNVSVVNAITLDIDWTGDADESTHFVILRSADNGATWTEIASLSSETELTDTDIFPGAIYCYRVRAANEYFESGLSESACKAAIGTLPLSPDITELSVEEAINAKLAWKLDDPFSLDAMFRVEKRSSSNDWGLVADQLRANSFEEGSLAELTDYCYRVQMYTNEINSLWSQTACMSTALVEPVVPFVAVFEPDPDAPFETLHASWSESSPSSYLTYEIQLVSGDQSGITMSLPGTTHTFTQLPDWTDFSLKIRAIRSIGEFNVASEWSEAVSSKTLLAFRPGDTDGNGQVDVYDILQFTRDDIYNQPSGFSGSAKEIDWQVVPLSPSGSNIDILRSDTNRDGLVDIFDFFAIVANYGQSASIASGESESKMPDVSAKQAQLLNQLLEEDLLLQETPQTTSIRDDLKVILKEYAEQLPDNLAIQSNYPNPFSESTTFAFQIPETVPVRLSVYNLLGQEIALICDETLPAGRHEYAFDAGGLSSGMYLYRIVAGETVQSGHMIVQK